MGGAEDVVAATGKDEDYGPLNAFLSSLTGGRSMTARMTTGALGDNVDDGVVQLGPTADARRRRRGDLRARRRGLGQPRARLVPAAAGPRHARTRRGAVAGPGAARSPCTRAPRS